MNSCVEDIVFGEAYRKTSRFSEQSRTLVEGGSQLSHSERQGESEGEECQYIASNDVDIFWMRYD